MPPSAALPPRTPLTSRSFHPDLPLVTDRSALGLGAQVEKLAAVARQLNLKDMTLVAHDWGSVFGYIFAAKYPGLISRVVQFDIGGITETFRTPWIYAYQHQIIQAWDARSSLPLDGFSGGVPNPDMLYWEATWPYVSLWNGGNDTEAWKREADPGTDPQAWGAWSFTPAALTQPILFFWGDCNDKSCTGPERSDLFFDPAWLQFLDSAPGSSAVRVHTDHWIYVYNTSGTLPAIANTIRAFVQ